MYNDVQGRVKHGSHAPSTYHINWHCQWGMDVKHPRTYSVSKLRSQLTTGKGKMEWKITAVILRGHYQLQEILFLFNILLI